MKHFTSSSILTTLLDSGELCKSMQCHAQQAGLQQRTWHQSSGLVQLIISPTKAGKTQYGTNDTANARSEYLQASLHCKTAKFFSARKLQATNKCKMQNMLTATQTTRNLLQTMQAQNKILSTKSQNVLLHTRAQNRGSHRNQIFTLRAHRSW